jgi:lysophospholipase L1-like esterase
MKKVIVLLLLCASLKTFAQNTSAPDLSTVKQSQILLHIEDFPGLTRYAAANATITKPPQVIFYGDSITDGWDKNGNTFFPGKPYLNRGISGQTTAQMLLRFRQDVIDLHPAAVLILAGTNDIAGNTGITPLGSTEQNLQSMAELARANHIRVILASVLPAADYPWRPGLTPAPKVIALNKWEQQYCATTHCTYLDYYTPMADAQGGMKPGISKDGIHPNANGYAIMQPLAEAAITESFSTKLK